MSTNAASTWSRIAKLMPTKLRKNDAVAMGLPGKRKERRDEKVEDDLAQFEETKTDTEERQRWCIGTKLFEHCKFPSFTAVWSKTRVTLLSNGRYYSSPPIRHSKSTLLLSTRSKVSLRHGGHRGIMIEMININR